VTGDIDDDAAAKADRRLIDSGGVQEYHLWTASGQRQTRRLSA